MGDDTFPAIERWRIPHSALKATLSAVRPAGRRGRESGVFCLGTREATSTVSAVVWPHGAGVVEARGRWIVEPEVYGVIGRLARANELTLLASAHTHDRGVPVALSLTDRRYLTRVPGILALVIGNGGSDADPGRWSWNVFVDNDFIEIAPSELTTRIEFTDGTVSLWRANATGAETWNGGHV